MSSVTHGSTPYYYVPGESRHPVMAAIGLAIRVIYFRGRGSIAVDDVNRMKG